MRKRITTCDGDDGMCPFDAWSIEDCRVHCGLGVNKDEEEYIPSSENGDYSPSNPWDAPGMSIRDFI
jgi:hypothetical protein